PVTVPPGSTQPAPVVSIVDGQLVIAPASSTVAQPVTAPGTPVAGQPQPVANAGTVPVAHRITISDPAMPPTGPAAVPHVAPGKNPYEIPVPGDWADMVIKRRLIEIEWVWENGDLIMRYLVDGRTAYEQILIQNSPPAG